jgi:hypothetical protein
VNVNVPNPSASVVAVKSFWFPFGYSTVTTLLTPEAGVPLFMTATVTFVSRPTSIRSPMPGEISTTSGPTVNVLRSSWLPAALAVTVYSPSALLATE